MTEMTEMKILPQICEPQSFHDWVMVVHFLTIRIWLEYFTAMIRQDESITTEKEKKNKNGISLQELPSHCTIKPHR